MWRLAYFVTMVKYSREPEAAASSEIHSAGQQYSWVYMHVLSLGAVCGVGECASTT